jgi:Cu-processing system ATP-binding protein
MITIHGLHKRFGRIEVLSGLDVQVPTGLVTALVGPNSAGKTTLLKVVLGLTAADAGRIAIDGRLLDGDPDYRAAIGYMPQIVRFPANQTGRELLETLVAIRGRNEVPDLSLAEALLLGDQLDRPLGVLSGGTRQKINAVLAFAFQPRLLILDEPTAGLDPLAASVLKQRILADRDRGATVLITSHVIPELERFADQILFLDRGRAAWQGEADTLRRHTGSATLEQAVARLLAGGAALEVA